MLHYDAYMFGEMYHGSFSSSSRMAPPLYLKYTFQHVIVIAQSESSTIAIHYFERSVKTLTFIFID